MLDIQFFKTSKVHSKLFLITISLLLLDYFFLAAAFYRSLSCFLCAPPGRYRLHHSSGRSLTHAETAGANSLHVSIRDL